MHTDRSVSAATRLRLGHITDRVIGTFFDVFNELGPGFLESVYKASMELALRAQGFHVQPEAPVEVRVRGAPVGSFRADLVVERSVLLELKAVRVLEDAHMRQVLNYLRASHLEVALLLNFGPKPQVRRVLLDNERKRIRVHP